jgi:protein-disulfide isomerase
MRAPILAAAVLLTTSTLATSACGQTRPADGATAAAGAVQPDSVRARADRSRMKGEETAPVTIIEVSDFQCPFCAEFAQTTYRQVDSAYVQTGRARMLYIHLPLSNHPEAFRAAEAAMCAGSQGKFWEMHDRIFAAQREWSGAADAVQRFEAMAGELEIDMPEYRDCVLNGRTASLVLGDAMQAGGAGISGTPSFIINGPGGQRALSGAVPFEQFAQEMDALLAAPAEGAPAQPGPPAQPEAARP